MRIRVSNVAVGLSALGALTLSAQDASAAITGVTGATTWLGSPPPGCGLGQLAGATAFAWDEQFNVTASVFADMTNNPGSSGSPVPGLLVGTFDSHFIHFDSSAGVPGAIGTVTFSSPIVGVLYRPISLDNTDAPFGALGTVYPTGYPFRGFATTSTSSCSILGNTISFNLSVFAAVGDLPQIRVLTQSVPTPGAAAVLGLSGLAAVRRRRRG